MSSTETLNFYFLVMTAAGWSEDVWKAFDVQALLSYSFNLHMFIEEWGQALKSS